MISRIAKFWKDDKAVVAIEFGMISMPFFTILFGMLEMSLFFASGLVLEGGTNDAGRLIRIGQVQASTDPEGTFRTLLCEKVSDMIPCQKLQYEVIKVQPNVFASVDLYAPKFDKNGNLIPQGFDAGTSKEVILVRAAYKYEFLMPFIGTLMTGDASKNWVDEVSTVAIKNEPFVYGT